MKLAAADLALLSGLLDDAQGVPSSEREAWLAASLGGDLGRLGPTLRELLAKAASHETGDLIDRLPVFTVAADAAAAPVFKDGDTVGPYRLQRELGRGGMGEVWLAQRSDGHLKRTVALKLPMLSARRSVLVQRFDRERDILGSLAHPHIARLYDAGLADDGQPYLALEYVEGTLITAYCDEARLDARARVALLRQVMEAVQYAHANLVIHRDLKPSNVLVTADGQAMLLDFGIAKLLQEERGEVGATELTQLGGRAMTPHYAAPEQLTNAPVSIATDVYALGLLLYELLAGRRPFMADTRAALEQAALNDVPPKPSQHKTGVLAGLPRGSRADLDTIVLKALKKVPVERYPTVNALADDLQRWQRGEPVLAQPDRLGYRLLRFVSRHRAPVAVGATALLALVVATAVALWQAAVATQEAERARQEATRAVAVQGFLTELFAANSTDQSDPQAAQRKTARELLDDGAERIDHVLKDAPEARIEVMGTMSNIYNELGLAEKAADLNLRRVALARNTFKRGDQRMVPVLLDCVSTLQEGPRRAEVPALLAEAFAVLDAAGDTSSRSRGSALREQAQYWRYVSLPKFQRSADEAAAFLERNHPAITLTPGAHVLAARAQMTAFAFEEAVPRLQAALAAAKRLGGAEGVRSAHALGTLGGVLMQQLKHLEAEERFRAALELQRHVSGDDHPETMITSVMYANLLLTMGRASEGTALHDAVRKRLTSGDKRLDAQTRANLEGLLGRTLPARGRPDLALDDLRKDIDDLRLTLPNSGPLALRELQLADALADLEDVAGAREMAAMAEAHWRAFADGQATPRVDTTIAITRARVALAAGDATGALALLDPQREAIRIDKLRLHIERSRALLSLGRAGEAQAAAEFVLQDLASLPEGTRPVHLEASALQRLGEAQRALGKPEDAAVSLSRASTMRRDHDAPGSRWRVQLERTLAADTAATNAPRSPAGVAAR